MTEAEWLASDNVPALLEHLDGSASDRKLRLFAVACCRRHWKQLSDESLREAVRAAEQYADDEISEQELRAWSRNASLAVATSRFSVGRSVVDVIAYCGRFFPFMAVDVCSSLAQNNRYWPRAIEQQAQADLVRDVFGNTHRQPTLDPTFLTSTARDLAEAAYADRAFDRLPILADALEDAGCTDRDILDHCRRPGSHARGCWVVDLVLGRE